MQKKNQILFLLYGVIGGLLISFSIVANSHNFFSDKNIQALKKDPLVLFSKTNTCQLESLLGKKDFDIFKETMALMTNVEDMPDYVSISGNVRGLFTIMEGFFRMSKSGQVWMAYLQDNKVHYFTNDEASLQLPPKIMLEWASRFKEVKWISKSITIKLDACN